MEDLISSKNFILKKFIHAWYNKAKVKIERPDINKLYDPLLPDFPENLVSLLKYKDIKLSKIEKDKLLACLWISYNDKTIAIEDHIINEACKCLFRNKNLRKNHAISETITQLKIDEEFHILMCLEVCRISKEKRDIKDYEPELPLLIKRFYENVKNTCNDYQKELLVIAYASIAELSINAYLSELSSDLSIIEINRLNTELHRQDEMRHAGIFSTVVPIFYQSMANEDKKLFVKYLNIAFESFIERDLSPILSATNYLNIKLDSNAVKFIEEYIPEKSKREYNQLNKMLQILNIDIYFQ